MNNLKKTDPQISQLLRLEKKRQQETLTMIASENHASEAVRSALSSELTNKYSEGYAKKRYYQGNSIADQVELLAIERAKKLFGVAHVNVQPYSGSPANTAVYFALLTPGDDKIMGLSLAFGGHLTHGSPVSFSGKYFKIVSYTLDEKGFIDYNQVEKLAVAEKPKIIVCGYTAYPRTIDFRRFAAIAKKVDAYLLADVSHIAGLIAGGAHPSPAEYADIIMTTTHKTLRGPRGAMIMVTEKGLKKDPELSEKIDKAVFPGLQGGPHDNTTAAIAVALSEASTTAFKRYAQQVVDNAKALAEELTRLGYDMLSGGTDNHLLALNLINKNVNGALASYALEKAGIITNKNSVPNDPMPPFYPSGVRIGTAALTTRGMRLREMKKVANWIDRTIQQINDYPLPEEKVARGPFFKQFRQKVDKNKEIKRIAKEIQEFCRDYPLP
jgi:glycine hydroxymethyltransferase